MKKTSIVMTCYDKTQTMRHISMLAVANITRYTNPDEYELIIVDCEPKFPFRDDYKVLKIDKMLTFEKDIGYFPAMNKGAKEAIGDYLCFIENDVFVFEGWLRNLRWYLEGGYCEVILPHQTPNKREQTLEFYKMSKKEAFNKGATEQGLFMTKKETFIPFRDDYRLSNGWKLYFERLGKENRRVGNTAKVMISHITGVTYYQHIADGQDGKL